MSGLTAYHRLVDLLSIHSLPPAEVREVLKAVDAVVEEAVAVERRSCSAIAKHFQRGADASQAILNRKPQ